MRQKICPLAKRKEEFRRNIVAPVFFNSRWEVFFNSRGQYFSTGCGKDGKWIFITLPAGPNQQFFMSEVILPKVFRYKLSTLRIFDFFCRQSKFCHSGDNEGMFITAAMRGRNISFPRIEQDEY